jgi:hypothetical protein
MACQKFYDPHLHHARGGETANGKLIMRPRDKKYPNGPTTDPATGSLNLEYFTYIYFFECHGYIKIGQSRDWKRRFNQIATNTPFAVTALLVEADRFAYEASLHKKFKAHHARGEWFHDCEEIRTYIDKRIERNHCVKHLASDMFIDVPQPWQHSRGAPSE